MEKSYYRIMLGKKSIYADEAYKGNFVGTGWFAAVDLSNKLTENWRDFNKKMIPEYLKDDPEASKKFYFLKKKVIVTLLVVLEPQSVNLETNSEKLHTARTSILWKIIEAHYLMMKSYFCFLQLTTFHIFY